MFTDPLFSLIIFIYVAVVFLYMFYAFCWKEPEEEEDPEKKVTKLFAIQVFVPVLLLKPNTKTSQDFAVQHNCMYLRIKSCKQIVFLHICLHVREPKI